jgi:hypothetical protein
VHAIEAAIKGLHCERVMNAVVKGERKGIATLR